MKLHLGCGNTRKDGFENVDYRETPATDTVVDLNEYPWPWPDNSVTEIVAEHVFEHLECVESALRECARVLVSGGRLRVAWPIGMNERADPDHKHTWVWDTPKMYCGHRPWDADVGLNVVERDVSLVSHLHGVSGVCYKAWLTYQQYSQGNGWWAFDAPFTSGEFTVIFENP